MRILITGGAGFIGQHLARNLVSAGDEVVALDTLLAQVHPDPDLARRNFPGDVVIGDVADPVAFGAVHHVDAVVHLAAETGTGQSMYAEDRYHRTNVEGTRNAARFAARRGVPLVALSSRAVYGEGRYECPIHDVAFGGPCCDQAAPAASREDDPHRPVSVYGETKSIGETVAVDTATDAPVTLLRPQNVVGPGQSLHNPYTGVLAAFLAMLRENKPLTIYGTGAQTRDFVHVTDVAHTIGWALDHAPSVGSPRVLNVGSGERKTLLEVARDAAAASPSGRAEITYLDVHRAGDIDHACADLTRSRELGAPAPHWAPADAIGDFIRASWALPGAESAAWDRALDELADRGLTS